jgi:hypothetical protein
MDEEELFFKRFPAEKQDQVRALVNYATLMGLSGKDLVSIGGKLDRIKATQERNARIVVVKGYNVLPIGKDAGVSESLQRERLDRRFKLVTATGTYHFENVYGGFKIKNTTTNKSKSYDPQYRDWGRVGWRTRERYDMLMDIHEGIFKLNF